MKHVSNIKKISKQRNRNYEIKTSKHTDLILTELTLEKDFKQFFSNIFKAHSLDNYQNGRATNLSMQMMDKLMYAMNMQWYT